MNIIDTKNLVKKYGNHEVVSGINLSVKEGETFGLLGPNGAGKSTTISMLVGLVKPTSGDIFVQDLDIKSKAKQIKKLIGLVPQDIALYPTLTAEENLLFWGKMYGIKGSKLKERVAEVLRIVDLEDRKKEKVGNYSGGMKRRINIAIALIHEPKIIIMDEPTVGIDPQSRNHILETTKYLNSQGTTIIYTSHYMEEVEYLCDQIAIIDHGKIIACDEKEKLKTSVVKSERLLLSLSRIDEKLIEELKTLKVTTRIDISEDNELEIYINDATKALVEILPIILKYDVSILNTNIEKPNLETVFLELTGRKLRD